MKGRGCLAAAFAAVVFGVAAPQALAATTWYVNDDGVPALPAGCAAALPTIAAGVAAAADGDTVFVCRGTYNATNVTVSSQITIKGQKLPPDLVSCSATRTSVTLNSHVRVNGAGGFAFLLDDDNITLTSLIIQSNLGGYGIQTSASHSGYVITKNLIQDNQGGIYLNSNGTNQTQVKENCLRENNAMPGFGYSGNATASDQGFSKGLIQSNRVFKHSEGGFTFHLFPANNVSIQGNIGSENSSLVEVRAGGTNVDVSANIHKKAGIRDVLFNGSVTNSKIKGNIFKDSLEFGIHLRGNFPVPASENTGLMIEGNIVNGATSDAFEAELNSMDASTIKGNIFKTNGATGLRIFGGNNNNVFQGNIAKGMTWGCQGGAGAGNTWAGNIGKPMNTLGTCFP